jgi:hypothetical protein
MGGATPKDNETGTLSQLGGNSDGNVEHLIGSSRHPAVGRHLSRKEGSILETLLSRGDVGNDNNGANDDGRFQMNLPPLINKQHNACFR